MPATRERQPDHTERKTGWHSDASHLVNAAIRDLGVWLKICIRQKTACKEIFVIYLMLYVL